MKKQMSRLLSWLLVLVLVLGMLPSGVLAADEIPSGTGTEIDPYKISSPAQLSWFRDQVNAGAKKSVSSLCAVLTANIVLDAADWTPIGAMSNTYSDYVAYGGTFDGDGHTISGLKIETDKQYQALFGYVKGGVIKNLTVSGSVESAAASNAYAAGIVAYGNPVTVETCTNQTTVTATAKGYAAGIAAYASAGSTITGCSNSAPISGCGDNVGGIAASALSNVEISRCINSGAVTNTGTPGGYNYHTGGIAGSAGSGSTVSMCGNTGPISSTMKRTGGIAGGIGGTISKSFNTGEITGIYGVGGIAGEASTAAAAITDCYNQGNVTCNAPASAFSDSNAKGVGGLLGAPGGNTYKAAVTNCYQTGAVTNYDTATADYYVGGVIGTSAGKNYSGVVTENLITTTNCYYLEDAAEQGDGYSASTTGITAKTAEEMKASEFVQDLSDAFLFQDGGYPMLNWQNPDTEYTVSFTLSPSSAQLTVKDSSQTVVQPVSGATYQLKNGDYTYEVSADEYVPQSGSFTVAYGGQTISISLAIKNYDYVFTTVPTDAVLTVEGQNPLADGRTYQLSKAQNPYRYSVQAFGYDAENGVFSVSGETDADRKTVTLTPQARQSVRFGPITAADGGAVSPTITISSSAWPQAQITADSFGVYSLPSGDYVYTISCSGYKTARGAIAVKTEAVTIPATTLEVQTAWDGATYTEPAKNETGAYLIGSPDELMWFNKNAKMTDSAILTADINLNENMEAAEDALYKWTPMGTTSSNAYAGSFDGAGYTVSGLYVKNAANGTGFFGYVGAGGEVKNLTVSGKIFADGNRNYTGGIVGDCKGTVMNCHNLAEIHGYRYVGGVVGDLESGGSMGGCSNRGSVIASDHSAGGLVGRIDSSSGSAVTNSFNAGAVTGTTKVGGVIGDQYAFGSVVSNVYNTGSVTATTGYAGGILGNLRSGTLKAAYTIAAVTAGSDSSAGCVAGSLEWASGAKAFDQVYYLKTQNQSDVANWNGCTIQSGSAAGKASDELKALAQALGSAFVDDADRINEGYPILSWQAGDGETDPDAPEMDPNGWDGKASDAAPSQIDGIYQITSPAELKWFANAAAVTQEIQGILKANLDLNNQPWTPIGGITAEKAFAGSLDGGGFTISNLYVKSSGPAGLFYYNAGEIKNLTVSGLVIGADYCAGITARNAGSITDCATAVTVRGSNHTAGITGYNYGGTVSRCQNSGSIQGGQYVAGIVAHNVGVVSTCSNSGLIWATGSFAAGVVGDNESAATLAGTVASCANSGHVVSTSAAALSFVGGVVGRNNNQVSGLYNTGNVECLGSCVGGALGLNTSGATASGLYSSGDVTGANVETATGEDYRIGGAVGNVISGVSDAYYLDTISIATTTGGTPISAGELAQKVGALANLLEEKPAISGTLELQGTIEVGGNVTAAYTGDTSDRDLMLYVWHLNFGDEESALAITDENTYQIPETLAGYRLHVKALDPKSGGVLTAVSEAVDGMNGIVSITGPAIVGKSLRASYSQEDSRLAFQWYRGSNPIPGARESQYTVTEEDLGYRLKVRVTGSKPGYVEKAMTAQVVTAEDAGVWPDSVCSEPANVGGVYVLTTQAELLWFASEVNGGNTAIKARLGNDLVLTATSWYPIGSSQTPFHGTFDGDSKTISGFQMTTSKGEQGFFGVVGGNGQVKNLHVSGTVNATGDNALAIGGIAGTVEGEILGCTFSGSVSGTAQVGGIVGMIDLHGMVKECRNTASVSGSDKVGGIAGTSSYGDIYYCVNKGTVGSADTELVGGIVGDAVNYAVITGSYNTGAVTGSLYVGGIAGKVYVASAPLGCYSVGAVTGNLYTGGVLGNLGGTDYITTVTGSFYLNSLPADKTATAKKEAEMKDSSFVSILNRDAYVECYVSDSGINNGYPILKWERDGHGESGGDQPDLPTKERIDVSFTLVGDTVHGSEAHTGGTKVWIETTQLKGLPNTTTAYDLFRQVLDQEGYTYEATGNSYIAFITSPSGVRLGEFSNGPYSGWMYTINDVFPDYMSSVTLNDGDNMVFFYTDDYRITGWNPNGLPGQSTSNGSYGNATDEAQKAVNEVMELISAIGTVTKESGAKIQAAREAYDGLSDAQKKLVSNYETLTRAEAAYAELTVGVPFTDVQGHWALEAIQYVYKNGLMDGVGNQRFQPNGTVNRAMVATILYRLEKEPAVTDDSVFSDVDCNAWYAKAIAWANANGIVEGIGGGRFAPTADITREQLAVMLYRYAQYKQYDTQADGMALNGFSDYHAISSWAVQAMQWMNSEALMTGRTETTIAPGGTATRAEAATIFMRFANNCAQ